MKIFIFILIIFFSCQALAVKKYALLIAISNYPEDSGFPATNAQAELKIIKDLFGQLGFRINQLTDQQATKTGIKKAFVSLSQQCKPGDIAAIYYVGHGSAIPDDDIPAEELDNKDEAIVPYDAVKKKSKNYIRDDEIGEMMNAVRKKLGPTGQFLFIAESCYSGTITRGQKSYELKSDSEVLLDKSLQNNTEMSPYVVLTGAGHDQFNTKINYISDRVGALTLLLAKHLPAYLGLSWHELYQALWKDFDVYHGIFKQYPTIEGDIQSVVFSANENQLIEHVYYVNEWLDKNHIVMDIGETGGIFKGAQFGFYPVNKQISSKTFICTGIVTESSLFSATVKANITLPEDSALQMRAVCKKYSYAPLKQTYSFADNCNNHDLDKHLEKNAFKKCTTNPRILIDCTEKAIMLYNSGSRELINGVFPVKEKMYPEICERITLNARAQYLRNLDFGNQHKTLDIQPVPVRLKLSEDGKQTFGGYGEPLEKLSPSGHWRYREGDVFVFRVSNKSRQRLYFNIVHISPDDRYSVIMPSSSPWQTATELKLLPYETKTIQKAFRVSPPLGKDYFLMVSSEYPIDLRRALSMTNQSNSLRHTWTPFEVFLAESMEGKVRGGYCGEGVGLDNVVILTEAISE